MMRTETLTDCSGVEFMERQKEPQHVVRALSVDQAFSLCEAPDSKTLIGLRDRAIIELLYGSGIRNEELCNLNLGDIFEYGVVAIRGGKRDKDRCSVTHQASLLAIEVYLKKARPYFSRNNPEERALFIGQKGRRLCTRQIHRIVLAAGKKLGLNDLHPHVLRGSCATHLNDNGMDIRCIAELLGHESVSTTAKYLAINYENLRQVYDRAHPTAKVVAV